MGLSIVTMEVRLCQESRFTLSYLRAVLSVCGRCSFWGVGCCSCRVRVCRSRGVLFSVGVCLRVTC